ncbi:MAG: Sec-independent protein translocase protein TatB [Pseudohongiellaceae bacterium]
MFDISFWELILICIVSLLVLGPDKLPGALRTAGLWIGRLRRSFNNIKADIEREVGADEIRRQLRNEAILEKIKNTKTQFTETVDSVKKQAESVKEDLNIEKQISDFKNEVNADAGIDESASGPDAVTDNNSGPEAAAPESTPPAADQTAKATPATPPDPATEPVADKQEKPKEKK